MSVIRHYIVADLFFAVKTSVLNLQVCNIINGELVEKGLMRRLSDNKNKAFDGMKNPFVFTWSNDLPNYTWAFASGCAAFYNSGLENQSNTRMVRYFDEDRFEI